MKIKINPLYFPIIFLILWLISTVGIFILGPYSYKVINPYNFYIYLVLIHISLFLGYFWGQTFPGRGSRLKIDYFRFVSNLVALSFGYCIIKLISTSGGDLSNLIQTFRDANKSYDLNRFRHSNIFSYLDMLFMPITFIAITNTLFNFNKINKWCQYSSYAIILIIIGSSIGSATRSGIIQVSMLAFAACLVGIYNKNIILKFRHKIFIMVFLIFSALAFLGYFSFLIKNRDVLGYVVSKNPMTNELPKENYYLFKIIPNKYHQLINRLSFYTSHSYYRLNLALNLPSRGLGFGLSNSYFVMNNIEKLTGSTKLKEISYPLRLDKKFGNSFGEYWSTFYTWIASDFTFPGTIIIVFIIGFIFSLAFTDSLYALNPFAVSAFCTLFYFIFHFAFNNPLQDGQGITINLFIPFSWLIMRESTFVKAKSVESQK